MTVCWDDAREPSPLVARWQRQWQAENEAIRVAAGSPALNRSPPQRNPNDPRDMAIIVMRLALARIAGGDPQSMRLAKVALCDIDNIAAGLVGGGRPKRGSCGCHVMCEKCEAAE